MGLRVLAALLAVTITACSSRGPAPAAAVATPVPQASAVAEEPPKVTVTRASTKLLASLKEPMQATVFVTRVGPESDVFIADLTELFAAYERAGQGKLRVELVEVDGRELEQRAEHSQMLRQALPGGEGYLGIALEYRGEVGVLPALNAENGVEGLEFWITHKMLEIQCKADGLQRRIGVVTGKGELRLDDTNLVPRTRTMLATPSLLGIMQQAFPFYSLVEVDLKGGAGEIDPSLLGLIVTQPAQDYTLDELRRIDRFLLRGKAVVAFASAANIPAHDAKLEAKLGTHGLVPLLHGYGIELEENVVFDWTSHLRIGVMTQEGPSWIRHPAIARVTAQERGLDSSFPPFFRLDELMFPFPSSLTLRSGVQPDDVELRALARSSADSSVETTRTVELKFREQWPSPAAGQSYVVAAAAEGKLKSAFGAERATGRARLLVIASSLFLTNPLAFAGNPRGNGEGDEMLLAIAGPYAQKHLTNVILTFKNTLDWMAADEDMIALGGKLIEAPKR